MSQSLHTHIDILIKQMLRSYKELLEHGTIPREAAADTTAVAIADSVATEAKFIASNLVVSVQQALSLVAELRARSIAGSSGLGAS